MSKFSTIMLAVAVSLGTTAMLANSARTTKPLTGDQARLATDGAFRDGLYLGKLAAEQGLTQHPASGRWSREQDRASFVAGYRQGYSEFLGRAPNAGLDRAQ
jgi:hypothetical protein